MTQGVDPTLATSAGRRLDTGEFIFASARLGRASDFAHGAPNRAWPGPLEWPLRVASVEGSTSVGVAGIERYRLDGGEVVRV